MHASTAKSLEATSKALTKLQERLVTAGCHVDTTDQEVKTIMEAYAHIRTAIKVISEAANHAPEERQ